MVDEIHLVKEQVPCLIILFGLLHFHTFWTILTFKQDFVKLANKVFTITIWLRIKHLKKTLYIYIFNFIYTTSYCISASCLNWIELRSNLIQIQEFNWNIKSIQSSILNRAQPWLTYYGFECSKVKASQNENTLTENRFQSKNTVHCWIQRSLKLHSEKQAAAEYCSSTDVFQHDENKHSFSLFLTLRLH